MENQKEQFESNKVLLWGLRQANEELLEKYDKGNKNPQSISRKKKTEDSNPSKSTKTTPKPKTRKFDKNHKYTIDDIDWLNEEYERLDKLLDETSDLKKGEDIVNIQNDIYDIVQKLEYERDKQEEKETKQNKENEAVKWAEINKLNDKIDELRAKYIQSRGQDKKSQEKIEELERKIKTLYGSGIKQTVKKQKVPQYYSESDIDSDADDEPDYNDKQHIGKPEPKAPKVVHTTKARAVKGSEEAKAIGQRLAEARRLKNAPKKEEEAKKKEAEKKAKEDAKQEKLKPWFYIGDIPKGYREAKEEEAIKADKVSLYGKYKVDEQRYTLFNTYRILLSDKLTNFEWNMYINIAKKKAIRALEDIEIYSSKLDNPKYDDKKTLFTGKLEQAQYDYKILQKAYNWLLKHLAAKTGKTYTKQIIKLPPKPEIKYTPSERTEAKQEPKTEPVQEPITEPMQTKQKFIFKRGDETITLNDTHFTKKGVLKSATAKKLFEQKIVLPSEYYSPSDYEKYHYKLINHPSGSGIWDTFKKFVPIDAVKNLTFNKPSFSDISNVVSQYTPLDLSYSKTDWTRKARAIYDKVKDLPIVKMIIQRNPVQKAITELMSLTSGGKFKERFSKEPYDRLFHLKLILQSADNQIYSIEKNEVVNMENPPIRADKAEDKEVHNFPRGITLKTMVENYQNKKGKEKFFIYDGVSNNCQDFVLNLLQNTGIGTQEDYNFIKQDTEHLFEGLTTTRTIMKTATDTGAMLRGLLGGSIVNRKPDLSEKDIIQSVLFNKNLWTLDKAKMFLYDNNFYAGSLDETKKFYRFRQYNPEDLKGRIFRNKKIPNKGIEFILAIKK